MTIKQRAGAGLGMIAAAGVGMSLALSLPTQAAVAPEPTETVSVQPTPTATETPFAEPNPELPSPAAIPTLASPTQVAIPAIPAPESETDPDEGEEVREPIVIDEQNGTVILYPGRMGTCDDEDGTTGVDGVPQDACFWPATGTGESFIVLSR